MSGTRYKQRDSTERLSIRLKICDEFDCAYYSVKLYPAETVDTGIPVWQVRIFITDYANEQQMGPPIVNWIIPCESIVQALNRSIDRFLEDLTHRPWST